MSLFLLFGIESGCGVNIDTLEYGIHYPYANMMGTHSMIWKNNTFFMYMFPFIYTFHLVNNKHQQKSTHTWKIALFLFDHILVGGIINRWSYRCDIITTPIPTRWHHTTGHYYLGGLRILLACPIGGSTARGATRWLPLMASCPLGSISVKEASWWPLHELLMPSRRQHSNRSHLGYSKETTHILQMAAQSREPAGGFCMPYWRALNPYAAGD